MYYPKYPVWIGSIDSWEGGGGGWGVFGLGISLAEVYWSRSRKKKNSQVAFWLRTVETFRESVSENPALFAFVFRDLSEAL